MSGSEENEVNFRKSINKSINRFLQGANNSTNDIINTFNEFFKNVPVEKSFDMTYKGAVTLWVELRCKNYFLHKNQEFCGHFKLKIIKIG